MLMLNRCAGESIWIGKHIEVRVLDHSKSTTRIGITAPLGIKILRNEIKDKEPPHKND